MFLQQWIYWRSFHCLLPCSWYGINIFIKTINILFYNKYFLNSLVIFLKVPPETALTVQRDPCSPSPCGPNAICQSVGQTPACTCLPNYRGSPPNCRPECTINSECPSNQACIQERCKDPCPGSCGFNALCTVFNHVPMCSCIEGYTGDPFSQCSQQVKPRKYSFSKKFLQ